MSNYYVLAVAKFNDGSWEPTALDLYSIHPELDGKLNRQFSLAGDITQMSLRHD